MKTTTLAALFLSACSATLTAQSTLQSGLSPFDSPSNPDVSVLWSQSQPDAINFPSVTPIVNGTGFVGGFNPAIMPNSQIHLNGGNVVVDSWSPAPEPGSGPILLFGAALVARLVRSKRFRP